MHYLEIINLIVSTIITVVVAFILYEQKEIKKYQLKLDLYEKRYKMYVIIVEYLARIARETTIENKHYFEFRIKTNEATFFFDDDIKELIKEIGDKSLDLKQLYKKTENGLNHNELNETEKAHSELTKWFGHKLDTLAGKFEKYLSFKS